MTSLIDHLPVSITTGSQELTPFSIPDAATQLTVRIARATTLTPAIWADVSTRVSVDIYLSFDGGVTFGPAFGIVGNGGVLVYGGVELVESWMKCGLPPGVDRRGKLILTVTNGPFISSATVETA